MSSAGKVVLIAASLSHWIQWVQEERDRMSDGILQGRQIQKEMTAGGCLLILLPRARQQFLP